MKITIEIPDTTLCAFVNYVFATDTGLSMGAKSINTDDIEKSKVGADNG